MWWEGEGVGRAVDWVVEGVGVAVVHEEGPTLVAEEVPVGGVLWVILYVGVLGTFRGPRVHVQTHVYTHTHQNTHLMLPSLL